MNIIEKIKTIEKPGVIISTLWIVVMFSMIYADILSFIKPGFFEDLKVMQISQAMLLAFAVLIEIPIAMIFLSRVLRRKINRRVNICASLITILFVIGGGSLYWHYIFFASIEVIIMIFIILIAWQWQND